MNLNEKLPIKIILGSAGRGKSIYSKLISASVLISHFTLKAQSTILVEAADKRIHFAHSVLGATKTKGLLTRGFDKWFINLAVEDQIMVVEKIMNLDNKNKIPVINAAITLLISYLIEQGTTLELWFTDYQTKECSEYLDFVSRVFKSDNIEGNLILSKIEY